MTNPDYAVAFFNVTTVVTATILGFVILSWIFWWENLGKNIKFELGKRIKYYSIKKFYIDFERNFFKSFERSKIPIPYSKKTYGDILRITKIGLLYVIFKRRIEKIDFKTEYKIINYEKMFFLMYILVLIFIGVYYIIRNISILYSITNFTREKLLENPTFQPILLDSYTFFIIFMSAFLFFIITIILHSFNYKRTNIKKK